MIEEKEVATVPSFLNILENGNIKVKTREGEFEIREPSGEEFDAVERIASKTPNITEFTKALMIVSKCLVKPGPISEMELKAKYKISTCKRLAQGVGLFVEDDQDFLWESKAESKTTDGSESSAPSAFDTEKPQTNSEQ